MRPKVSTEVILHPEALARLQAHADVITRGTLDDLAGVVDELTLIRALEHKRLAGAGLDVFDPEPPLPDNPLLRMPNVVVTPHVASNTDKGIWRMSQSVAEQVLQVLADERPAFLIDSAAWPGWIAALLP